MKKIKELDEEKDIKKKKPGEDESRWSAKRIAFFVSILAGLIFFIFYILQARGGQILGETDISAQSGDSPQIELPTENDVEEILEEAEENISNVNPNDIINSQPQIQETIKNLEKLVNQETIKNTICSAICSSD